MNLSIPSSQPASQPRNPSRFHPVPFPFGINPTCRSVIPVRTQRRLNDKKRPQHVRRKLVDVEEKAKTWQIMTPHLVTSLQNKSGEACEIISIGGFRILAFLWLQDTRELVGSGSRGSAAGRAPTSRNVPVHFRMVRHEAENEKY